MHILFNNWQISLTGLRQAILRTYQHTQELISRTHNYSSCRFGLIVLVLFVRSVCLSQTEGVAGEVDAEVIAQLQSDGVSAWQRLKSYSEKTSYTGSATQTSWYFDSDRKLQRFDDAYTCRVRRHFSTRCGLIEKGIHDGRRSVEAINPEYAFELRSDSKRPAWILDKAGTPPESPGISSRGFNWDHHSWMIDGRASLIQIATRPEMFRIDEAVRVSSDPSVTEIRLKVTNLESSDKEYVFEEHRGRPGAVYSVVLEPAKDWSIVRFETEYVLDGVPDRKSGEIEYATRPDGPVFPSKISLTYDILENDIDSDEVVTMYLEDPQIDSGDLSEFYLPHYGIDDSAIRGDTRGRLWRFGYFVIGVAALVIAWRVLKKRAEAGSA